MLDYLLEYYLFETTLVLFFLGLLIFYPIVQYIIDKKINEPLREKARKAREKFYRNGGAE